MPKRTDLKKILIIGAGPIIIGQACEFDYSGTQACKALKEEGYEVVLVNSNPATIMTDPAMADKTYIEPLTPETLEMIMEKERPDAVLPTVGGQTALNLSLELYNRGILDRLGIEMIGANSKAIEKAETRHLFKKAMEKIGLESARSDSAFTLVDARRIAKTIGYPCVVRPAFTLGGMGGGIVDTEQELDKIVKKGLEKSMNSEVLIEESIVGWKEFELEVMRDTNDNVVIVCSIENIDPIGVHTGDSITVAPAQTLTDVEYQNLRDASIAIIREIGVDTGGSNIQFAVNPVDGRIIVIEMNPRVSRSSALASKATGFPIAKFAAKLAVGYTLDELQNDITKKTPACFEPSLDYVVVKLPRFNFEKFPLAKGVLTTSMKSVGEAMSIGRTFKESLQKGIRSLEIKRFGFGFDGVAVTEMSDDSLLEELGIPSPNRLFYVHAALQRGFSVDAIFERTLIDPWFLYQFQELIAFPERLDKSPEKIREAKELGFSDRQLTGLLDFGSESEFRAFRKSLGILPTYGLVDTCAGEFEAYTPYFYSTYETENEARVTDNEKVMILGGGPNRIGQGIEFDYCCVHASLAIRELGLESIMVNSNPETVSTDFDISDKLFFEPLTFEDVVNIYDMEKPKGVIVQFGGQTPLNLALQLETAGIKILGTSPDAIDRAEDRERFQSLLEKLGLRQPDNGTATSYEEAQKIAARISYPVVVRPSYVLGGASMKIVYSDEDLKQYMSEAIDVSPSHPILVDKYLTNAIEMDVDSISDGTDCVVAGIMQHIEEAGVHSGDSACVLPPVDIDQALLDEIQESTKRIAIELNVIGLMNIQYAIKDGVVYLLEVNPRASRSIPFVCKATGVPWAKMATKVVLGKSIKELNLSEVIPPYFSVKEVIFPFNRFPGTDILLGPEMKSTGEVMGIESCFENAYLKGQLGVGQSLPMTGKVLITVSDTEKEKLLPGINTLVDLGFELYATSGTANYLKENGVSVNELRKMHEASPTILDMIKSGEVGLVINTPTRRRVHDEKELREAVLEQNIPFVSTIPGMLASIRAIAKAREAGSALGFEHLTVNALQDLHALIPKA